MTNMPSRSRSRDCWSIDERLTISLELRGWPVWVTYLIHTGAVRYNHGSVVGWASKPILRDTRPKTCRTAFPNTRTQPAETESMLSRSYLSAGVVCALLVVSSPYAADKPQAIEKPKVTKSDFEGMMKSLSNWGRWGADDELGTLNLITPEKRKQAAGLVKEGVTVSLSHDASKTPIASSSAFEQKMVALPQETEFSGASDEYRVAYHGFSETHIDALCHMSYKGKLYNGYSQKEVTERGAAKLSVLNIKQGIVTRGILMDMPRLFGVRFLEGGQAIFPAHLEAWEKAAGVKVESGDVVLIRTGRWERAK